MNAAFFELSADLKKDYHKSFASGDDQKIFLFFKNLLKFIENDNSSYNVLILFNNPLKNEENITFMRNLNRNCRNFLNEKQNSEDKDICGAALCYIGIGHEYGLFGYERNLNEAFGKYLISSRLNHSLGTYRLALCFEQGKGIDQDNEKALYFYRCAAKLGLVDALHVYGSVLANGYLGLRPDQKMGLHYLSLAAIKANKLYPYPFFDIGKWYETKQESLDVSVDEKYSFDVYMKGASLGDPNSQYRIAKSFENGELKQRKSIIPAIDWYMRAADNGQVDAQMTLFGLYSSGLGENLRKDPGKSYYWALRAGLKGSCRGMFFLGEYARSGTGINQDVLLALWWYTISASMGSYEAKIKMRETRSEIERRDIGPEIPYTCCGIVLYRYYDD